MRKLWGRYDFLLHRQRLERELAEEMDAHREMMPPERRSQLRKHHQAERRIARGMVVGLARTVVAGSVVRCAGLGRAPGFHPRRGRGARARRGSEPGGVSDFRRHDLPSSDHSGRGLGAAVYPCLQARASAWASLGRGGILSDGKPFVCLAGFGRHHFRCGRGRRCGLCASNLVSANYFGSLGIVPAWGRLLDARDAQPGAAPVAVWV